MPDVTVREVDPTAGSPHQLRGPRCLVGEKSTSCLFDPWKDNGAPLTAMLLEGRRCSHCSIIILSTSELAACTATCCLTFSEISFKRRSISLSSQHNELSPPFVGANGVLPLSLRWPGEAAQDPSPVRSPACQLIF